MEKRVVSELLSCLDKLPDNVKVIAATSRPESLESSIRRGILNIIIFILLFDKILITI